MAKIRRSELRGAERREASRPAPVRGVGVGNEGESRASAVDQAYVEASGEVRRVSDETGARLRTLGKVMRAEAGRVEKRITKLAAQAARGNAASRRALQATGAKHAALADRLKRVRAHLRAPPRGARCGDGGGGETRAPEKIARDTVTRALARVHAVIEAAEAEGEADGRGRGNARQSRL